MTEKLKLPASIKVGPYDYTIKHEKIHPSDGCIGDFDSETSLIRITTGIKDKRAVETLVHEIFHAIYYSFTLSGKDKEERTVSIMSQPARG